MTRGSSLRYVLSDRPSLDRVIPTLARRPNPGAYRAEVPPAWPDDGYLNQLGRVVYSIASLEGSLLFDLPRMPEAVGGLSPQDLAGYPTTLIGKRLVALAPSIRNESWRRYIERGGEALVDLGPRRNSVLHARPATIAGEQRLHRWRIKPREIMPITTRYLDELLEQIEAHRTNLNRLRPEL